MGDVWLISPRAPPLLSPGHLEFVGRQCSERLCRAELAGHCNSCHQWAAGASVFKLCKSTRIPFYSCNLVWNLTFNMVEVNFPC